MSCSFPLLTFIVNLSKIYLQFLCCFLGEDLLPQPEKEVMIF